MQILTINRNSQISKIFSQFLHFTVTFSEGIRVKRFEPQSGQIGHARTGSIQFFLKFLEFRYYLYYGTTTKNPNRCRFWF